MNHYTDWHSSIAIDYLWQNFSEADDIAIAFIYFNHKISITPVEVIGSLFKHLMQRKENLSKELNELYSTHTKRGTRPTFPELTHILEIESRTISKFFVVFDALDECTEQDNARTKILMEFQRLPNVRLMVTGRPDVIDTVSRLGDISELEIRARDEDISKYFKGQIHLKNNLSYHCRNDPGLEEKIKEKVVEKAKGM
jgi:hypothetical protein